MCKVCQNDYFTFHQKTYFKETAAQPVSTAEISTEPSQEDLGQGELVVSAAPTPETNAMFSRYEIDSDAVDLRRDVERLERQRNEARAKLEQLFGRKFSDACFVELNSRLEKAKAELAAAKEQLTAMRELGK